MKRFNVTVNGVAYDVTVDEIGGAVSAPIAAVSTAAAAAAAEPGQGRAHQEGGGDHDDDNERGRRGGRGPV